MGEFLYFGIYVFQQLGIMLGVGAQTVLLCTHLLNIHRAEPDAPHASYAAAARKSLSVGFFLIIVSGLAAVAVHILGGNTAVLFAPAFLFKWLLIVLALGIFLLQNRLSHWSDVVAWLAGGTWYALFLVHTLAPITSWFNLVALYGAWLAAFGIIWVLFVLIMRKTAHGAAPAKVAVPVAIKTAPPPPPMPPKSVPPPPPAPKPIAPVILKGPSFFERFLIWLKNVTTPKRPTPKPVLAPPPPPAPKPIVPPPPLVPKPTPIAPPLALAPMLKIAPVVVAPAPKPVAVPPVPPVPPPPVPPQKHTTLHDIIDHLLVPALRIMPQTPADVGKQNRPPVVKPDVESGLDQGVGIKID